MSGGPKKHSVEFALKSLIYLSNLNVEIETNDKL
jgi:hypothetical protein